MTINCTREQKEALIEILKMSNVMCLMSAFPYPVECTACDKCLRENIEWEIYDDEEEENDGEIY